MYGRSDNNGTKTKKVFIIKAKPIQIPKRRIQNLLFLINDQDKPKDNNPRIINVFSFVLKLIKSLKKK